MNEQDIINRLVRIEKALGTIMDRLPPTQQQYAAQLAQRPPYNWPWDYPAYATPFGTLGVTMCAAGSSADPVSAMGPNGDVER